MKKKISWWESKYSDYTHMTEDDDSVTLHTKDKLRNGLCCLTYFREYANSKGKILKIAHKGYISVVLSLEEYNKIADVWETYEDTGYL